MTPEDAILFFSKQMERCAKGLNVSHASKNWHLAALNYRQLFKCHLMRGLAEWRLQRNPTSALKNAVSVISEGLDTLRSWSPKESAEKNLPVETAALLSCLTDSHFELENMGSPKLHADCLLDLMLAGSNLSDHQPEVLIAKLVGSKRTRLAGETYHNYFNLLTSNHDIVRAAELISYGEQLFIKRQKDSYFTGGDQTEGGGPDNQLVVDYRLAVAIKRTGLHSNSPHAWIW